MENKDETSCDSLFEDMCNIARVLPNLTATTIYAELNGLKNNPERVQIILRKYFAIYNQEEHNCLSDDIKKIKRVLPLYPVVKINNDLLEVEDKENRVQLVIKKFVDNEVKSVKRSSNNFDSNESCSNKKLKSNDPVDFYYDLAQDTSIKDSLDGSDSILIVDKSQVLEDMKFKNCDADSSTKTKSISAGDSCNQSKQQTIYSVLSSLFPQYSTSEFSAVCKRLNINLCDMANECSVNLIVNDLLSAPENAEIIADHSSNYNESCSTQEYDELQIIDAIAIPLDNNVVDTFQESLIQYCERDLGNYISETQDTITSSEVKTSSINNEHVNSDNSSSNDTVSTFFKNLFASPEESLSSKNVDESEFLDSTTKDSVDTNCVNKDLSNKSSKNMAHNKTNNVGEVLPNIGEAKPSTSKRRNSHLEYMRAQSIEQIKPSRNRPSLIPSYNSTVTQNSGSKAQSSHIIKPAKLQLKPNTENTDLSHFHHTAGSDHKNYTRTKRNSIIKLKPAVLQLNNEKIEQQKNIPQLNNGKIEQQKNIPQLNNGMMKPREYAPPLGWARWRNLPPPPTYRRTLPRTSTVVRANDILDLPSTSSFVDIDNINPTISVRTDLYDTYFNGPIEQSTKSSKHEHKHENGKSENDDIIFVSREQLPEKLFVDLTINKNNSETVTTNLENCEPATTNLVKENMDAKDKPTTSAEENHPFYYKLLEIFPDISPDYLRKFCSEIISNCTLDDAISILLNGNYTKRDMPAPPETHLEFEEQHKLLQDLFPDADPTYLQHHCERLIDQPEQFTEFVANSLENRNYPTKVEYLKKMKLSAQEKQYTTDFDVKKFLEVIPNPEEYFKDPKRQAISEFNFDDINYAVTFLKNTFCTTAIRDITKVFKSTNYNVLQSANLLANMQTMKSKRKPYAVTSCKNIPLLQEIAYVKHKAQILEHIRNQELQKELSRELAKASGLMKTCQCCFDDEVMPDDTQTCESGKHIFCKSCVRKGCEVLIGDGKQEFPCLEACDSFFTLQVLQAVLSPNVFSKLAQRKQLEEVKSAGIEDLEFCPFCDFATIPAPEDKIFRCLNDDCMKESCRLCKEPSHIPLRCDEVEKDHDIKMRTYIEDKMTEALLRKCYKCGVKFIKETGCNKMTCSCGAMMCYVCNKPVKDYKHFNGQGGDQTHLCPLYSDTNKMHVDAIKRSAASAKEELGLQKKGKLKIDPTVDLEQHYKRLAAQNPAINNIGVVMPPNAINH